MLGNNDLILEHTENSKNSLQTYSSESVVIISILMGMWGSAMFGTPQILGALYHNIYNKGDTNIVCSRSSYNVMEA